MKKGTDAAVVLLVVFGLGLVGQGFSHASWPSVLPWLGLGALARYAAFFGLCLGATVLGSYFSRRSPLVVGGALVGVAVLVTGNLWPLLVSVWFILASVLLGRMIFKLLRLTLDEGKGLMSFMAGAGVYGSMVGLLAHFPVNYPGVYGLFLVFPVVLRWRDVLEMGRGLADWNREDRKGAGAFEFGVLDTMIAAISLVYVTVSFMPELGYDALATHLFVPVHMSLRHQWGFDVTKYVWAVFPMLGDWIFSIGCSLAGETGARFLNVTFVFILSFLVHEMTRWAGASRLGGRWAVLIFLSTPLVFAEGSTLYVDALWSAFLISGIWMVLRFCSGKGRPESELPLAGLFLGMALNAKSVTIPLLIMPFLIMVWRFRSWFKSAGRPAVVKGFCLFFLFGSIPHVTAWILTGNPVFFFLNSVFKSPYFPTSTDFDTTSMVYGQGLSWNLLYRWTFESHKFLEASTGAPGFQWLLVFLPTLLILFYNKNRRGLVLFFLTALTVVLVFHFVSYLRYIFPAWVLLSSSIGVALDSSFPKGVVRKLFHITAGVTVVLNLLFLQAGAFYRDFPLSSIVDGAHRRRYLAQTMPIRHAVETVNEMNVNGSPVAVFAEPRTGGLASDGIYPAWYNWKFSMAIRPLETEADAKALLEKNGVEYVILDSNWQGANCCPDVGKERQALIERITEPLVQYGTVSVRRLRSTLAAGDSQVAPKTDVTAAPMNPSSYRKELLSAPDFKAVSNWNIPPQVKHDIEKGILRASVDYPATQFVGVIPGESYFYEIVARCADRKVQGRMQVNWMGDDGFISTDIQVYDCTPQWTTHTMMVTAPKKASGAMVFVSGHSSDFVEFDGCSFRRGEK